MNEMLDFAEKQGRENMQERIEVAGMIQREAQTTVAMLLGGAGAALAFSANATVKIYAIASLATSLYLFILSAILIVKCLGLVSYPASANEPKNLYKPDYSLDQIRVWELDNLQARIGMACALNEKRAALLNRIRMAAAATPIIAAVAFLAGY